MTAVRCEGPHCSAIATPVVAGDRWGSIAFAGRLRPVCSRLCAVELLDVLVTVGGFPRRPAPAGADDPFDPFSPAAERLAMPSERRDGTTAAAVRP